MDGNEGIRKKRRLEEKIEAAKKAGVRVVLIGRPKEEEGLSEDEVKRYLVEN